MARRKQRKHKQRSAPGAAPGTLVVDPNAPQPVMQVMAYGDPAAPRIAGAEPPANLPPLVDRELKSLAELPELMKRHAVVWLDVRGLGNSEVIQEAGRLFRLHRLWLEDVINVHQRPKVEHSGDVRYVVLHALDGTGALETEQISLFLGPGFVLTFQERVADCFQSVRVRAHNGRGRLRIAGPDYLAYALIDMAVDQYFPYLEQLGERIEALEDTLLHAPTDSALEDIHALRREMLTLRRAVWPLREAIHHLVRERDPVFEEETRVYLADCYDHTVQIIDLVESYREVASGLIDVYHSSLSHKMNEVMKVLTVISTIFIPLTFLAGIYGMNFDPDSSPTNMPELRWPWGYLTCLGAMGAIAFLLVLWFRKKGWILARRKD